MKDLLEVGSWLDDEKDYQIGTKEAYDAFVAKRNESLNQKYWTICFPGEYGQNVQETWRQDQILNSYYPYWKGKMLEAGKGDMITTENCLDDWIVVNWAVETDQWGNKL